MAVLIDRVRQGVSWEQVKSKSPETHSLPSIRVIIPHWKRDRDSFPGVCVVDGEPPLSKIYDGPSPQKDNNSGHKA